jgi:hypothetical protein
MRHLMREVVGLLYSRTAEPLCGELIAIPKMFQMVLSMNICFPVSLMQPALFEPLFNHQSTIASPVEMVEIFCHLC